ncbi:hypothetical protein QR680_012060 [Steinernema hermaphroditum]|uniref:Uncharacterized protein n=1 Tax=Steinernema hermaphroditum TaxID=289476 RepID=A0AA39I0S6_9BILA|nr:hypothetical protein QR680_012060 [Steinernema hermaphroditum]
MRGYFGDSADESNAIEEVLDSTLNTFPHPIVFLAAFYFLIFVGIAILFALLWFLPLRTTTKCSSNPDSQFNEPTVV